MQIMPGVQELCALCDAAGIPRGLITRNVSTSVEHLHGQLAGLGLASPFQPAISRESSFAYKPSPEALLHMATVWGVPATQLLMVGDSVKDDIVSGNRAGALTALLDLDGVNGYRGAQLEGEQKPTFIVHSLHELLDLLRGAVDLKAPGAPAAFKPGEAVPAA
ncbi:hypothetical protein QJQ45_011230 [Haematococcus lacustris]|nr:hypothetical protein QJQ45_011230 [Haematococcus lacustris]